MTPDDVTWLARKYDLLIDLRRARESAEETGQGRFEGDAAEARRERMREVAREYPGALRELDLLSLDQLTERRRLLESSRASAQRWAEAILVFHRTMRTALDGRALGLKGTGVKDVWAEVARLLGCTPQEAEQRAFGGR